MVNISILLLWQPQIKLSYYFLFWSDLLHDLHYRKIVGEAVFLGNPLPSLSFFPSHSLLFHSFLFSSSIFSVPCKKNPENPSKRYIYLTTPIFWHLSYGRVKQDGPKSRCELWLSLMFPIFFQGKISSFSWSRSRAFLGCSHCIYSQRGPKSS